eukprot:CFRG5025T1
MTHKISYVIRSPKLVFVLVGLFILVLIVYKDLADDLENIAELEKRGNEKEEVYLHYKILRTPNYVQPVIPLALTQPVYAPVVDLTQSSVQDVENISRSSYDNNSAKLCTPVDENIRLEERQVSSDRLLATLKNIAVENKVIVSFASNSQRVLLRNFMCSVKRYNTNWLIVPFDKETAYDVERLFGESHLFYDPKMLGDDLVSDWNRDDSEQELVWRNLMHIKVNMVRAILLLGYDVFVADADTSVVRNIPKHANLNDGCDFKFQPDSKYILTYEGYRGQHKFNCGVYFARSSVDVLAMYGVWIESFNCLEGFREQRALHTAMAQLKEHKDYYVYDPMTDSPFYTVEQRRKHGYPAYENEGSATDRLPEQVGAQKGLNSSGGVKMCYFHPKDFPNGGAYFGQNKQFRELYGAKAPVLLHTNYMKSKLERKIHAFEAVGAWFLGKNLQCSAHAKKPLAKPLSAPELYSLVDL